MIEEDYTTGDASLDDPRNADGIGETELLAVSFGTSYNENRRRTIGAIETALERAFPDMSVRRAFTSGMIINRVRERDGVAIDDVQTALTRAAQNGVRKLVIQPTHLMDGYEYHDLAEEAQAAAGQFEKLVIGRPVLSDAEDFRAVMNCIVRETADYDDGRTAVCFMGHGTGAESNAVYAQLQKLLHENGHTHYYIGTVEAEPALDHLLREVAAGEYTRVVLQPLMIVAGDHANNDMASDEKDSWKTAFASAGYEVVCVLRGMGEMEAVQQLLIRHAEDACAHL